MYTLMKRPHSRDAPDALLQASRCPWDIEMDHDVGILKIHSLAQQVRSKKEIDLLSP